MTKGHKLRGFYMALVLVFLYIPIVLVVVYSFNNSPNSAVWEGLTFKWYGQMLSDGNLKASFYVSVKVALLSAAISSVIGTVGAVSLGSLNKKLRSLITGLAYAPLIVPEVIMGVALLLFLSLSPLSFGVPAMVIAHSTFCIPYVMIMVNIRLSAIDSSIIEAARDLGAGKMKVFTTITLPLIAPGIVTGSLLAVAMSMDDVIISFFLTGPRDTTLPVRIYSMLKLGVTPEVNALCTILLLFTFGIVGIIQLTTISKTRKNRTIRKK